MTRIEAPGLEIDLAEWLEMHRGHGRLLRKLIGAAGETATLGALRAGAVQRGGEDGQLTPGSLISMVCTLNAALDDLGFPAPIQRVPGIGYRMDAAVAAGVLAAVAEMQGVAIPLQPVAAATPEDGRTVPEGRLNCRPAQAWALMARRQTLAQIAKRFEDDPAALDAAVWRWRAGSDGPGSEA